MNRRERMLATLRGQPVDRPPLNFYEINGYDEKAADPEPFNIYSHPSWLPLIQLAREKTDRILRRMPPFKNAPPDPLREMTTEETCLDANGSRLTTRTVRAGRRTFVERSRRDPDVNTVWTTEHLLKNADDLRAWLELPAPEVGGEPDVSDFLAVEKELGDTGIVMLDSGDPLCHVAQLFDMAEYTVAALTEPALFHRALERAARVLYYRTEALAKALPGRLWRVVGSEYASPPYLPPRLYHEYEVRYVTPMVQAIQKYGGFARIHSHGNLRDILDGLAATGCAGLDPIEPPPQGDVELSYVREKYGQQMVLFGNLEASDIENLSTPDFAKKVSQALREGTAGKGRGFVLQPSACPYGRVLSTLSLKNYEKMVELVEKFR